MPHYYVDFPTCPPPFDRLMPGGVGYISKGGLEVLYGHKPPPFERRVVCSLLQYWQPSPAVVATKVLVKIEAKARPAYVSKTVLVTVTKERGPGCAVPYRKFKCRACDQLAPCNRHHPIPREIEKTYVTVRLCIPCHVAIHYLSNAVLATMDWEAQKAYILATRFPTQPDQSGAAPALATRGSPPAQGSVAATTAPAR